MNDGSYAVAEGGESNRAPVDDSVAATALNEEAIASSPQHDVPKGGSVAEQLVAARICLGLSTSEIASRTRITLRHVEALECGDYTAMPGRPYAIGFARSYARAVGLDDARISDAVRRELQGSPAKPEQRVVSQFEVGDPAKTPSPLIGWIALLLVGAILAMGGVYWRSYYAPAVSLPSLVPGTEQASAQLTHRQANAPKPTGSNSLVSGPVNFTALEQGIWVKFYDGEGKQLMQKQLAKGESYTVPADAVGPRLWTGRPDALSITIAGQPVPRLADAEKVMKDVPVDAASLRALTVKPSTSSEPARSIADSRIH